MGSKLLCHSVPVLLLPGLRGAHFWCDLVHWCPSVSWVWHKGNENTVGNGPAHSAFLIPQHSHLSSQHSGVVPHSRAPHSAFLSDLMRDSHSLKGAIKAWNFHGRNAQSQLCNDSIKYSDTNQILRSFWCPVLLLSVWERTLFHNSVLVGLAAPANSSTTRNKKNAPTVYLS